MIMSTELDNRFREAGAAVRQLRIAFRLMVAVKLLRWAVVAAPKDDDEGLCIIGSVGQLCAWLPTVRARQAQREKV
jgi:hypothetical protein